MSKNLLLAADFNEYTAWILATNYGKEEVCEKIWMWAEKELTSEELKNNLLLAQCDMEPTSWHLAAKKGNRNQLHKLWEWCKQELPPEDLNKHCCYAKMDRAEPPCTWQQMRAIER
jgi:endo-1,4-beta-D-glucanase Y